MPRMQSNKTIKQKLFRKGGESLGVYHYTDCLEGKSVMVEIINDRCSESEKCKNDSCRCNKKAGDNKKDK